MFLQNIPILKITECAKLYTHPQIGIISRKRRAHGLVFFIEGTSEYIYSSKKYTASAGSVLFLPCGKEYIINRLDTAQCIYIDFLTDDNISIDPFVKKYPNTPQLRDCFYNLLSLFKQKRIGYESEMMSGLYKLISLIQIADRTSYFPGIKYHKIAPAIDYINRNYCNGKIKMSELAKLSGVSTRYFNELFSFFFGVSPKEYIIRMQIETAKNLLSSSVESIGDIASSCGFSDVYYFSKTFRKSTGTTPSEYRRTNKTI